MTFHDSRYEQAKRAYAAAWDAYFQTPADAPGEQERMSACYAADVELALATAEVEGTPVEKPVVEFKNGILGEIFPNFYKAELTRPEFGDAYVRPEKFEHAVWTKVARFEKDGGDGQPVEIEECRWPARFYRVKALGSVNSVGEPLKPFTLSTGSGMEKLAADLARAISQGMLGLDENQ